MLKVKMNLEDIKEDDFFNSGNLIKSKDVLSDEKDKALFVSYNYNNNFEGLLFKQNENYFDLIPVCGESFFKHDKELISKIKKVEDFSTIVEIIENFFKFLGEYVKECDIESLKKLFKSVLKSKKYYNISGDIQKDGIFLYIDICSEISVIFKVSNYYQEIFLDGYFVNKETDKKLSNETINIKTMLNLNLDELNIFDILENMEDYLIEKLYNCL